MSLRRPGWAVAGWAVALGVLASLVRGGWLWGVDRQVAGWMAELTHPMLYGAARTLTFFGSPAWTVFALLALGLWGWRRDGFRAALILAGVFVLGVGLQIMLRLVVAQWRPDMIPVPPSAAMDILARFELAGFPSGHAYRSAFVFGWLARTWTRSRGLWLHLDRLACVAMIVGVGWTRLYLNRHWLSDVLGSWLLVLMVLAIAKWWTAARRQGTS